MITIPKYLFCSFLLCLPTFYIRFKDSKAVHIKGMLLYVNFVLQPFWRKINVGFEFVSTNSTARVGSQVTCIRTISRKFCIFSYLRTTSKKSNFKENTTIINISTYSISHLRCSIWVQFSRTVFTWIALKLKMDDEGLSAAK